MDQIDRAYLKVKNREIYKTCFQIAAGFTLAVGITGGTAFGFIYGHAESAYYKQHKIVEHSDGHIRRRCAYDVRNGDAVDGDCSRFYRGRGFNPESGDNFKGGHVFQALDTK